jgi:TPR repeat protein
LAQANLGVMYYEGSGVKQDYMLAKKWFEAAAKQGDAEAQGILGLFYEYGLGGVSQNYAQAKVWYRESCMNGNQNGCYDYQKLN